MKVVGYLSGGTAVLKKYQVNATHANAGVPTLIGGAGEAGLDPPTTTALNDMVGITLDTATYATAQVAGGSPEALVTVDIRPDAIIHARLSGNGTTGTALTQYDVTVANTAGTAIQTDDDWSSTSMDEGAIWGYDGANAGQLRKITSVSTTTATVTVAFDYDTVVGDNFLRANFFPMDTSTVTLTSDFLEIDTSVAVATNTGELMCIELIANDIGGDGTLTSAGLFVARDHILKQGDA